MKKKLEAELISIAHRILKLKNKSELHQLHQEAQNLYEKLSVLVFVEEHFASAKPTIGLTEAADKIASVFDTEPSQTDVESQATETAAAAVAETEQEIAIPQTEAEEEQAVEEEHKAEEIEAVAETETEEEEETVEEEVEASNEEAVSEEAEVEEKEEKAPVQEESTFKPAFELSFETKDEEIKEQIKEEIKNVSPQIAFDDLLGPNYVDPVFVKPEELEQERAKNPSDVIPIGRSYNDAAPVISLNKDQGTSLNDRMSKGIIIGLNDRIAFMSHLFANSSEDYNRVLSQLMTFDTFGEAKDFIDTMVKPDYNNWEGKDEYAERFMEIIEKRFS